MPYNPGVQDISGQLMAQGITQGIQGFTRGVQDYFQKEEQRKKQEATMDWLEQTGTANQLFPQLAQVTDPAARKKVISAGIKGAGLDNLVQVQKFMDDQQRQAQEAQALNEMRAAQAEKQRADADRARALMQEAETERAAIGAATAPAEMLAPATEDGSGPADGAEPDRRMIYFNAGGRNPAVAAQLMKERDWTPKAVDMGDGTRMLTTSPNSAVPDPNSRPSNKKPKNDQPEYSTDGRFYRSGPEDDWKPVPQTKEKAPDVKEWYMMGKPDGTYAAFVKNWRQQRDAVPEDGQAGSATPARLPKFDASYEGKTVKGPDGKLYVIKNGQPVLK